MNWDYIIKLVCIVIMDIYIIIDNVNIYKLFIILYFSGFRYYKNINRIRIYIVIIRVFLIFK